MADVIAVIPAAGVGRRMGSQVKKQYLTLRGKPILYHTLQVMEECTDITSVVLVVGAGEEEYCQKNILGNSFSKIMAVVPGGDHRQTSVFNGLSILGRGTELVVIHDGARPLIRNREITAVIKGAREIGAAALSVPLKDTVKVIDSHGLVLKTPSRESLRAVQTPQVFKYNIIMEAHQTAKSRGFFATDDCALVEAMGRPVKLVDGSYENIKITTPEDLVLADAFLARRTETCELE
ncbi:2-C-methyl-D-erythritol 4-phosphate cytidylyltransferase [Desulforamulus aquiferis]|uniref:2-C-methyl-D-erythritol 4-phosphate cytidylyltransferase n=1 Tax=Desulforamulus aquiferis TaxID=1397668 RepID=A0AAW7ZL75_9FIRM|nr:2-C-methyl-D-erythritol 4-phosphate cytidylyltransferase [Desulforamulus aquiferis]MDO7788940.1 2-C-methyl-D-erythritol 4-phosphate cytidylyltransferase [Desulforamulus aquiferis]